MPSKRRSTNPKISDAIAVLKNGGIVVLPTDTLYGIVGSAFNKETVARIYRLRKRNLRKPMIILIGSLADLAPFGVRLDTQIKKILKKLWPGKVSVVLVVGSRERSALKKFEYLHRGTGTLAFRLPKPKWLRDVLKKTGPLVAPSANFEGDTPALTIRDAQKYFGKKVSTYIDRGKLVSKPSTLVAIKKGRIIVLRKGAVGVR